MSFDAVWFSYIYGLSHRGGLLDAVGVFFAEYAAYVWGVLLVIAVLVPHRGQARVRVAIAVGVITALIARLVVKSAIMFAYPRPRPFVSLPDIRPLISTSPWESMQSFPSGHAIFFFALATVLFRFEKKIGLAAFVAAAIMGAARVYVGVHWPSDIIGGAVLGILTGWLAYSYYIRHETPIINGIGRIFRLLHL